MLTSVGAFRNVTVTTAGNTLDCRPNVRIRCLGLARERGVRTQGYAEFHFRGVVTVKVSNQGI